MTPFVLKPLTTESIGNKNVLSPPTQRPNSSLDSFRGEFSFVNKDAATIDDKSHADAVTRHVVNRYARWKKSARLPRQSATIPRLELSLASQSVQHGPSRPSPIQKPTDRLAGTTQHDTNSQSSWEDTSEEELSSTPADATPEPILTTDWSILKDCSSISNTSPTNMHVTGALPSFDDVPERLINTLTSFAYEYVIAETWPQTGIQNNYEIMRSWDDTVAALQDRCYADAFFALLAAIRKPGHHHVHQFQLRANTELRHRIGRRPQDLLTLKAILKLFSSETVVDNAPAARGHLKMLKSLVEAQEGIILLDPWFKEDLLSCDCYFALKHGTRPFFPAQEWSPGPLSEPWKARLRASSLGSIDPAIEHPALKSIFTDLRELFKVQNYVLNHDVPSEDQLLRWRQLRKLDCISRLADHRVNLTIYPHLYDKPKIQLLVTIATSLLANIVLGSPEPVCFGLKFLTELRKAFVDCPRADEDKHLQLWTLYVGSLAEKVHPVDNSEQTWFANRLGKLAVEFKFDLRNGMKDLLRHFLFCESLHQEVASNRAYRTQDALKGLYSISGTSWRKPVSFGLQPGTMATEGMGVRWNLECQRPDIYCNGR